MRSPFSGSLISNYIKVRRTFPRTPPSKFVCRLRPSVSCVGRCLTPSNVQPKQSRIIIHGGEMTCVLEKSRKHGAHREQHSPGPRWRLRAYNTLYAHELGFWMEKGHVYFVMGKVFSSNNSLLPQFVRTTTEPVRRTTGPFRITCF